MSGLKAFLSLRTFIFRPSVTVTAYSTKCDLFSSQLQSLSYSSSRTTKHFSHAKDKNSSTGNALYRTFLALVMIGGIYGIHWQGKNDKHIKSKTPFKVEAASALAESNKRKSKKNEDSDSEHDVEEGKPDSKGKKKERPGFRDRKV